MRPTETEEQNRLQPPVRKHRRKADSDQMLGLRNILNIIFMLLALAGVVVYVWVDSTIGTYIVLTAMGIKMVECCLRMLR